MTSPHISAARAAEARAVDHARHGRHFRAGVEYAQAAAEWNKAEVDADRAGDAALVAVCIAERDQKRRKAQDAVDAEWRDA